MGVVYLAHDPRSRSARMPSSCSTPDLTLRTRFCESVVMSCIEAQAASALDRPQASGTAIHEINETPDGQLCTRHGHGTKSDAPACRPSLSEHVSSSQTCGAVIDEPTAVTAP